MDGHMKAPGALGGTSDGATAAAADMHSSFRAPPGHFTTMRLIAFPGRRLSVGFAPSDDDDDDGGGGDGGDGDGGGGGGGGEAGDSE